MPPTLPPLFSSLFRYRQTEGRTPTEDFLTEALVGFLRRSPVDLVLEFLSTCFIAEELKQRFFTLANTHLLTFSTQRQLPDRKRLDILVEMDGRAVLVIENKINAAFQNHSKSAVQRGTDRGEAIAVNPEQQTALNGERVHQLESYASWLHDADKPDGWPGLIVILTHSVTPPADIMLAIPAKYGVASHVCYWQRVHNRLRRLVGAPDYDEKSSAWVFIGRELCQFLESNSMGSSEFNSTDIAAINVAMVGAQNAYSCFQEVGSNLLKIHNKVLIKKGQGYDTNPESSKVWGWTYFPGPGEIFVGYGFFFPPLVGEMAGSDPELPDQEHAFIAVGSDSTGLSAADGTIPGGWSLVNEGWSTIKPFPLTSKGRGESFAQFFLNLISINMPEIQAIHSAFASSLGN